jgi:hypothetical protein
MRYQTTPVRILADEEEDFRRDIAAILSPETSTPSFH